MKEQAADLLTALTAEKRLLCLSEAAASQTSNGGWCAKEILGHLIDSAANNHHRIVRLQCERLLEFPPYQQDDWVRSQRYREAPWHQLVDLWVAYNRHLAHIIERLDSASLSNRWACRDGEVTLEFLVVDYLGHLHHHLDQIFTRYDPDDGALTPDSV